MMALYEKRAVVLIFMRFVHVLGDSASLPSRNAISLATASSTSMTDMSTVSSTSPGPESSQSSDDFNTDSFSLSFSDSDAPISGSGFDDGATISVDSSSIDALLSGSDMPTDDLSTELGSGLLVWNTSFVDPFATSTDNSSTQTASLIGDSSSLNASITDSMFSNTSTSMAPATSSTWGVGFWNTSTADSVSSSNADASLSSLDSSPTSPESSHTQQLSATLNADSSSSAAPGARSSRTPQLSSSSHNLFNGSISFPSPTVSSGNSFPHGVPPVSEVTPQVSGNLLTLPGESTTSSAIGVVAVPLDVQNNAMIVYASFSSYLGLLGAFMKDPKNQDKQDKTKKNHDVLVGLLGALLLHIPQAPNIISSISCLLPFRWYYTLLRCYDSELLDFGTELIKSVAERTEDDSENLLKLGGRLLTEIPSLLPQLKDIDPKKFDPPPAYSGDPREEPEPENDDPSSSEGKTSTSKSTSSKSSSSSSCSWSVFSNCNIGCTAFDTTTIGGMSKRAVDGDCNTSCGPAITACRGSGVTKVSTVTSTKTTSTCSLSTFSDCNIGCTATATTTIGGMSKRALEGDCNTSCGPRITACRGSGTTKVSTMTSTVTTCSLQTASNCRVACTVAGNGTMGATASACVTRCGAPTTGCRATGRTSTVTSTSSCSFQTASHCSVGCTAFETTTLGEMTRRGKRDICETSCGSAITMCSATGITITSNVTSTTTATPQCTPGCAMCQSYSMIMPTNMPMSGNSTTTTETLGDPEPTSLWLIPKRNPGSSEKRLRKRGLSNPANDGSGNPTEWFAEAVEKSEQLWANGTLLDTKPQVWLRNLQNTAGSWSFQHLMGCTVVLIFSRRLVYIAYIWDMPQNNDAGYFQQNVINVLSNGDNQHPSLNNLTAPGGLLDRVDMTLNLNAIIIPPYAPGGGTGYLRRDQVNALETALTSAMNDPTVKNEVVVKTSGYDMALGDDFDKSQPLPFTANGMVLIQYDTQAKPDACSNANPGIQIFIGNNVNPFYTDSWMAYDDQEPRRRRKRSVEREGKGANLLKARNDTDPNQQEWSEDEWPEEVWGDVCYLNISMNATTTFESLTTLQTSTLSSLSMELTASSNSSSFNSLDSSTIRQTSNSFSSNSSVEITASSSGPAFSTNSISGSQNFSSASFDSSMETTASLNSSSFSNALSLTDNQVSSSVLSASNTGATISLTGSPLSSEQSTSSRQKLSAVSSGSNTSVTISLPRSPLSSGQSVSDSQEPSAASSGSNMGATITFTETPSSSRHHSFDSQTSSSYSFNSSIDTMASFNEPSSSTPTPSNSQESSSDSSTLSSKVPAPLNGSFSFGQETSSGSQNPSSVAIPSLVPLPSETPNPVLSILIDNATAENQNTFYWRFFQVSGDEHVGCNATWANSVEVNQQFDLNTTRPNGNWNMTLFDQNCEYKNDGKGDLGALFCGNENIPCQNDPWTNNTNTDLATCNGTYTRVWVIICPFSGASQIQIPSSASAPPSFPLSSQAPPSSSQAPPPSSSQAPPSPPPSLSLTPPAAATQVPNYTKCLVVAMVWNQWVDAKGVDKSWWNWAFYQEVWYQRTNDHAYPTGCDGPIYQNPQHNPGKFAPSLDTIFPTGNTYFTLFGQNNCTYENDGTSIGVLYCDGKKISCIDDRSSTSAHWTCGQNSDGDVDYIGQSYTTCAWSDDVPGEPRGTYTKALAISMSYTSDTSPYTWSFFGTDYSKAVGCRQDVAFQTKNINKAKDAPANPEVLAYPGGTYSLKLFGESCTYTSNGKNNGLLDCPSNHHINCYDDGVRTIGRLGQYQCGKTWHMPMITCPY